MSDMRRASFRNRTVGIVFQFYHLLPELTALENTMLPARIRGESGYRLRDRARRCLDQVGMGARANHKPSALSGGELQRAAIARALVNEPEIMLCDEPTGNLDSKTGQEIAELLVDLPKRGRLSLVLITHEATLAKLADTKVVLRDGRIV